MRKTLPSEKGEALCRKLQLIPQLPTVKQGEDFLSFPQLRKLLALRGFRCSLTTLYKYQALPLAALPALVKALFQPLEVAWYVTVNTPKTQAVVPVGFLTPEIQRLALTHGLTRRYHARPSEPVDGIDEILADAGRRIHQLFTERTHDGTHSVTT